MYHSRPGIAGGLDLYVRQLVEALADCDGQNEYVLLLYEQHVDAWNYRQWPAHIQPHVLRATAPRPSLPVRTYRRWRRLWGLPVLPYQGDDYVARQIDMLGLDLVHYPATLIRPLSLRVPCLLTFFDLQHEYYPEFFSPTELAWRASVYRPSVDKAVHLIVPSRYTAQTLNEKYGVPSEKMTHIPVGAQPGFQRATPAEVARVRSRYGLPEDYVYYPANPWPHKNHARLMAALRVFRHRYGAPPKLVLSGRLNDEVRDARQLAVAAGVEHDVLDLGFVPLEDLPALYTGARLLVFPSLFEGFGIPLLEAMACECPIAAARATTIPEVVREAAVFFDPFDPADIAEALQRLLSDLALCHTMTARARSYLSDYAWPALVPRLAAVYGQTASRQRASAFV